MENFDSMTLPESLMHTLAQMQFTKPTPIQAQSIPHALEGKDILGSAQTGTGKTAAFGIPLVSWLESSSDKASLILTPTRELAVQVRTTLIQLLGKNSNIKTALLIGGESMGKQLGQLQMKPRIIVGTPGRINDHLERKSLKLHNVGFFVLDEIDRMLDIGLGLQVDAIVRFLPKERQTLMFSATLPDNIVGLSQKYLTNPVRVAVGSTTAPIGKIKQESIQVEESDKYDKLLTELNQREGSIIIFVKTKFGAERLAIRLCKENHSADAIHGDLRQNKRDRVISAFRSQKYRIMVATDIAARGLDIPHIEHVINYDMPQCPEDYIHRIGRTARAGAEGFAVNLISPLDGSKWRAIHRMLNPGEKLPYIASSKRDSSSDRRGRTGRPGGNSGFAPRNGNGRSEERRGGSGGDRFGGAPRPSGDRGGENRFGGAPRSGANPRFSGQRRDDGAAPAFGNGEGRRSGGGENRFGGAPRPSGDRGGENRFGNSRGGNGENRFGGAPRPSGDRGGENRFGNSRGGNGENRFGGAPRPSGDRGGENRFGNSRGGNGENRFGGAPAARSGERRGSGENRFGGAPGARSGPPRGRSSDRGGSARPAGGNGGGNRSSAPRSRTGDAPRSSTPGNVA